MYGRNQGNHSFVINEEKMANYFYCLSSPILHFDENGNETSIIPLWPDWDIIITQNAFGCHNIEDKIPLSYLISAAIQLSHDPLRDQKPWGYSRNWGYGRLDCNTLLRAICKSYYNSTAYSSLNLGTKVSTVVKALKDGEKKPIQGKSDVSAGYMLISKSMEHMALSIGQYGYVEYSIIESAARFHGVHRTDDWEIGTGERQFYYYCPIKIVDYSAVTKYNPWETEWIILK